MPSNWSHWIHAICNTKGSWLPGDPRGFRDHDHRVHSTGNYRNPPPRGEHADLHRSASKKCPDMVRLSTEAQRLVADAFAQKILSTGAMVSALAIDAVHLHSLVRAGPSDAKPLIGRAKQRASHSIRHLQPGSIWAQGCHIVRIKDENHWNAVRAYILGHERHGAIILDQHAMSPVDES